MYNRKKILSTAKGVATCQEFYNNFTKTFSNLSSTINQNFNSSMQGLIIFSYEKIVK